VHTVTGVIVRPAEKKMVEWVIGIADRDDNDQWIPNAMK
jgi:hypothetical protein